MSTPNADDDNPETIWSTSSPKTSPRASERDGFESASPSTRDIWASLPRPSTAASGYNAAYISTPPPGDPASAPAASIDDLDPFSPTTHQGPLASATTTSSTTLLGTGVGRNSKLILIDTDSDEERDDDRGQAELRERLHREALELDQREREHAQQESPTKPVQPPSASSGFNFVGNVLKSLSSAATSPSTSRPSTPSKPKPPAKDESQSSPPLQKPFASIASVFRSSPTVAQPPAAASSSATSSSPPSSLSLLSAIAGKGKEKQPTSQHDRDHEVEPVTSSSEKASTATASTERRQPRRRIPRRERRPDPVFDFTKFLEQMRTRQADPIAKYLRSFLKEFSRKPPQSTNDQTKVINDFLDFISQKMRNTDPWKTIYQEEAQRSTRTDADAGQEEDEERAGTDTQEEYEEKDVHREDENQQEARELEGIERAEIEFDLSLEAMEKLVMNRLWHLTFTPALDPTQFEQTGGMSPSGDLERDQVVRQRIRLFGWIEPKHLDLPESIASPTRSRGRFSENDPGKDSVSDGSDGSEASEEGTGAASSSRGDEALDEHRRTAPQSARAEEGGGHDEDESKGRDRDKRVDTRRRKKGSERGFIEFAASELRKMNQYKAPRDKLICVLNCCKVIFGLIRHVASSVEEQGADTFIPLLIYVVLQANPDHLVSNLQYIQRFRNPEKLAGEGGYYLSSLNAAISFIETLDASALSNIDQAEFEHKVANAVKLLASEEPPPPPPPRAPRHLPANPSTPLDETSSASLIPNRADAREEDPTAAANPRNLLLRGSDSVERAMSKPIGALARIFEQIEITANEITGQTSSPPGSTPVPAPRSARRHNSADSSSSSRRRDRHRDSYFPDSPDPAAYGRGSGSPRELVVGTPRSPVPDPALYAPASVSDATISATIERRERESHEAKMNTLIELFSSTSDQGEPGESAGGREGGEGRGGIEREVIEMVLFAEGGDVGKAVERLLEMA